MLLGVIGLGVVATTVLAGVATLLPESPAVVVLTVVLTVALNIGLYLVAFRILTPQAGAHPVAADRCGPRAARRGPRCKLWAGWLVARQLRHTSELYGFFGIVLGLLFFLFLAAQLVVYAAEINVVASRKLYPRSLITPPLTDADEDALARQGTGGGAGTRRAGRRAFRRIGIGYRLLVTSTLRPSAESALQREAPPAAPRSFWRDNALSIASLCAFLVFVVGMTLTGWHQFNADQLSHHDPTVSLTGYLGTGHFFEALFENWESEFLQMGGLRRAHGVPHPARLGRVEEGPTEHDETDDDPRAADLRRTSRGPSARAASGSCCTRTRWPSRSSCSSWARMLGHVLGGVAEYNNELASHGEHAVSTWGYFTSSQFWFESFQNWQSEFLAVFSIVVLTIFLRQRGSSESKPVAAPTARPGHEADRHMRQTGT